MPPLQLTPPSTPAPPSPPTPTPSPLSSTPPSPSPQPSPQPSPPLPIDWSQLCTLCGSAFSYFPETTPLTERGVVTVTCGHSFHLHCLVTWLQEYNDCPECGGDLAMVVTTANI